jgi:hypothetical protein
MWTKVSVLHPPDAGKRCLGARYYYYAYRHYPPQSPSYERCISLTWCSTCRTYAGTMVFIACDRVLVDALAGMPRLEREAVYRSEVRLLDHLDRLARKGSWPPLTA